jgi:hypothetical protein
MPDCKTARVFTGGVTLFMVESQFFTVQGQVKSPFVIVLSTLSMVKSLFLMVK